MLIFNQERENDSNIDVQINSLVDESSPSDSLKVLVCHLGLILATIVNVLQQHPHLFTVKLQRTGKLIVLLCSVVF